MDWVTILPTHYDPYGYTTTRPTEHYYQTNTIYRKLQYKKAFKKLPDSFTTTRPMKHCQTSTLIQIIARKLDYYQTYVTLSDSYTTSRPTKQCQTAIILLENQDIAGQLQYQYQYQYKTVVLLLLPLLTTRLIEQCQMATLLLHPHNTAIHLHYYLPLKPLPDSYATAVPESTARNISYYWTNRTLQQIYNYSRLTDNCHTTKLLLFTQNTSKQLHYFYTHRTLHCYTA